jgi:hypothetical protein
VNQGSDSTIAIRCCELYRSAPSGGDAESRFSLLDKVRIGSEVLTSAAIKRKDVSVPVRCNS